MTEEELQEIVDYYTNLLIIQYHDQPKAKATVDLFIAELIASGVMFDVRDGYDIDSAVGVQLDLLGKYVGVDRFYYSQDFSAEFFGFADATTLSPSANIVGFNDAVAGLIKVGSFLDAEDVVSTPFSLNDESYRIVLKLKIVQNNTNHSTQSIDESLAFLFPNQIIFSDNLNMTIAYLLDDTIQDSLINAILQKKCFPKPAGVGLQVITGQEFFGFADADNLDAIPDYVKGFNDATLGLIKDGSFLNAENDIRS